MIAPATYMERCMHVGERPNLEPGQKLENAVEWAQSIPGWMSDVELRWLAEQACQLEQGSTWVEVGSWKGRSFAAVALAIAGGCQVVAVDTWQGTPSERETWHHDHEMALPAFMGTRNTLAQLRPDVQLNMIETTSTLAATLFGDGSIDVVFIDAAHDYESVKADIAAWLPKVKAGGILCGHDGTDPNVLGAIWDSLGYGKHLLGAETIWYYRTPMQGDANA